MGSTTYDGAEGVVVDRSGNVYTTGAFTGTVDFDPGDGTANLTAAGNNDIYVSKFDAAGNYVWVKRMGGTGNDVGLSVAVDGSGNVYVTGLFSATADFDPGDGTANLTSAGSNDIFVGKLDASGNYLWAKRMGGSAGDDRGSSMAVDGSGNVYTTGYFNGTVDFDPSDGTVNLTTPSGVTDIFVSKLDASGNYVWAVRIGGTSYDLGTSIALDGSGNVHLTGFVTGTVDFNPGPAVANLTGSANDIFVLKLDASSNYIWAKRIGNQGDDESNGIAVDGSGNVYTTGFFTGTVDFDPGAGTANLVAGTSNDIFILKLDASGNYVWAKRMGSSAEDRASSVTVDGSGNVYTTGYFTGTVDFDPGAGTANLVSAGDKDIFISKLDASGNYVSGKSMGGSGDDRGKSIAVDGSGNSYTTGFFYNTVDFDPGAGTANLISAGNADIFVSKLGTPSCALTVSIGATPSLLLTEGTASTLTASGATSYVWSTGESTAAISVSLAGIYSVTGTTGACSATAQVQATSSEAPFSVTTSATPSLVCAGNPIDLSVAVSGGTQPYNYTWSAPAGIILSGNATKAVSATASSSGVYTLTITVAGSGTLAASTSTVSITANAAPTVSIAATPSLTVARGTTATLTASSGSGQPATRYSWSTGATTASISINEAATYSVTGLIGTCPSAASIVLIGPWATVITTGSVSSVVLSPDNCPAKATVVGSGNRFHISGPGNYNVNALFRTAVVNKSIEIKGIVRPGTYVFSAYGRPGVAPVITTFEVTGTGCVFRRPQTNGLRSLASEESANKTLDSSPLSLTLSPSSGTYTVGQSVTATFSGGQDGTDYVLLMYDDASYSNDLSDYITATNSTTGQNTMTWQTGQTEGQFEVQFEPGSEGSGRILEVASVDPVFESFVDSRPFDIAPCSLMVGIAAMPSLTITQGQSANLTASGADTYRWSTGETTAAISASTAGAYSVTGSTGACSATASIAVTMSDAGANGPACDTYLNSVSGLVSGSVQDLYVQAGSIPTVYAATDNGLGISTDGGLTFSTKTTSNGLSANNIQSVIVVGNTIYAGTYQAGLNISTNGGASWTLKTYVNGLGGNNVYCFNVQGSTIYAGTDGGLSTSTDGGASWTTKNMSNGLVGNYVLSLFRQGNTIYAGTNNGLSISTDGGNTFVNKTSADGLPGSTIMHIYAQGSTIYVGSYDYGVGISTDGGNTWTIKTTANGLFSNRVLGIYAQGNTVYAATTNGLSISTDGGASWTTKTTANGLGNNYASRVTLLNGKVYVGTYSGVSICNSCVARITASHGFNLVSGQTTTLTTSTATSYRWSTGETTQSISVNPTGTSAATTTVYSVTIDLGACTPVGSTTVTVSDAVANGPACDTYLNSINGLGSATVQAVQVVGGNVYAGTDSGLGISTDGGNSFTNKTNDNVLSVFVLGNSIYAGTNGGGLSISTDGGATFINKTAADGLGGNNVYGVFAQGNTVYAATDGGLSISTDGGATWINKTTADGLASNVTVSPFVLGNTLYVGTVSGLNISYDGGQTFITKTTADGLAENFIWKVYAVGSAVYLGHNGAGISISTDGGNTFSGQNMANGLAGTIVHDLYAAGNTVYVATEGGLSISTDGGATWNTKNSANGFGSDNVMGVSVVGNKVYAATSGGLSYCQQCSFTLGVASTNSLTLCPGSGTTLTATPTGNAPSITYLWSTSGSGQPETTAAINVTPATTTVYSVTGTVSGCSVPASVTVTVSVPPIHISASNGLNLTRGQSTTITASGANSYSWSTNATTASIVVSPTSTTSYTVIGATNTCPAVAYPTVFIFDPVADGPSCDTYSNRTNANGLSYISKAYVSGDTVYATSRGVYISTDQGRTFTNKIAFTEATDLFVLGHTIYVSLPRAGGLLISTDGGTNWVNKTTIDGLSDTNVSGVYAVASPNGNTIYAATISGLSISTDGGNSFITKTTDNGLGDNTINKVYVQGNTIYAATHGGLSISTDGGNTFVNKTTANGLGANIVYNVYAVGNAIYAATYNGGLSISTDGGNTFINKTTIDGLASNTVNGVYAQGHTIYAATDAGLSISLDRGTTWTTKTTTNGLGDNQVRSVFVQGNRVYAATQGGLSICPAFCDITISASNGFNLVRGQSTLLRAAREGGASADSYAWSTAGTSASITANPTATTTYTVTAITGTCSATASITVFVFDPVADGPACNTYVTKTTVNGLGGNQVYHVYAQGNTVYAATNGGLSISTDGGTSFVTKTTATGLGSNSARTVFANGSNVYVGTDAGLSISTDGGDTWSNKTEADNGLAGDTYRAVYAQGNTVYVGSNNGLSISTDGGNTFASVSNVYQTTYGVYARGNTIYAATSDGLQISTNGGSTWSTYTTIDGLGDNALFDVFATADRVYVGNNGGLSFCPPPTAACSLTVGIAATPSLTITQGQSANLTASGATTYQWSTGASTSAISVSTAGPYSVTGTSGACSATASATLSVTQPAPCNLTATLTTSTSTVCQGSTVLVTASVSQGATTFQWYKDGQSLGAAQQQPTLSLGDVQPGQQGSYVLVVTGCGSATSSAFSLTVNPLPTVTLAFPQSATVNPSGPTITVPAGQNLSYQVFGGVHYDRKIIVDQINGFEIRQVMDNATGIFPMDRLGLYTIVVTGANGCQRTVQGIITTAGR